MKASDLKALLMNVPDDVELVVGDPDCGNYWMPVIDGKRIINARKVNARWADTQLRKVQLFALHRDSIKSDNEHTIGCHLELRVLN